MSKVISNEINSMKNETLANLLQNNFSQILLQWKESQNVLEIFNTKAIDPDFFIKHFGSRVLNYFIGVLKGENEPGSCPVIMVMLKFLSRHNLTIEDIYKICSGKRNSVVHTLLESDIKDLNNLIASTNRLFDANFSGVIREYTHIMYGGEIVYPSCAVESHHASVCDNTLLKEYFATDEEDNEKILFRTDDADDLLEYFAEVSERLSLAVIHSDPNEIIAVANIFSHASSILLHYSPYLDTLAASMSELSSALMEHSQPFMEILKSSENGILRLFDAVSSDMDRYIERFSVENIAMKNSHHIHEPTSLSIRQIITMFSPTEIEEGDIEFF